MLNRGYAYATIISSRYDGQTLLSHMASLYPHSTQQAWQQKLNNGEVTLNGVIATGDESLTSGQALVWNRPSWIEPDVPQHFEVLFDDPHLLAVNVYTVISGVFYIGLGDRFDPEKLEVYPPGSVIVLAGNTSHFHWAKSGEYITQVSAQGPSCDGSSSEPGKHLGRSR